jgi:methylphosphotriester-DNA--protein-cysteine methyltransferase
MLMHKQLTTEVLSQHVRNGTITLAGNSSLKIYGLFTCSSGKRMMKKNRVFFKNETEAIQLGYRPCGHCMYDQYKKWRLLC